MYLISKVFIFISSACEYSTYCLWHIEFISLSLYIIFNRLSSVHGLIIQSAPPVTINPYGWPCPHPTNYWIGHVRKHHSLAFQTPFTDSTHIYKSSYLDYQRLEFTFRFSHLFWGVRGRDQDQDSLLVKRRNDNHSPGGQRKGIGRGEKGGGRREKGGGRREKRREKGTALYLPPHTLFCWRGKRFCCYPAFLKFQEHK